MSGVTGRIPQLLAIAGVATALVGCLSSPDRKSKLYITSDEESSALTDALTNYYEGLHPDLTIVSSHTGRSDARDSLASGNIDAILLWTPPHDEAVFLTSIGQDLLVLVTNPENNVTNLSEAQVRLMLTGQVANWKEVGGVDSRVSVIAFQPETSVTIALEQTLLGNGTISHGARLITGSSDVLALASSLTGGLGYLPRSLTDDSVKQISVDGISPTLENARSRHYVYLGQVVFVSRVEPTGDLREFLNWVLSSSGQQVVRRYMLGYAD